MISKSFLKSSITYTIGGALPMIAGLILLPFYANRLSEVHYTQVQFYISISLLLQILFSYSIESYFGIKYTQLSGAVIEQKKFVGTVSILLLLIGAGLLVVTSLSGEYIFSKLFNPDYKMEFWPYGFLSVLTAFFNSYFKASTNALIYFKKPLLFFASNFTNSIFTIGISIGGLILFPDTIIGPMYGRLLSGVVIFFIAQYIYSSNGIFKFEKSFVKDLQLFCTPFIFYVISGWVLGQVDRYVLQSHISITDLNTYDLALKCFFGIEFLQNSLSAIIFPKLYEIWGKQDKLHTTPESNRYFNVFTAVNIMQLIIFCIALPLVFKLLIHNEKFYESGQYIGVIAAGYGLRSILNFYLSTILFSKKPGILLKIFGISALFQLVLTYFAIRNFGLIGAIYTAVTTKIVQVFLSVLFTREIFVFKFNYYKIFVIPLIYIVINIIQFQISNEYNVYFYLTQLALFTLVFYFIFKNEIKIVTHQYLKKSE